MPNVMHMRRQGIVKQPSRPSYVQTQTVGVAGTTTTSMSLTPNQTPTPGNLAIFWTFGKPGSMVTPSGWVKFLSDGYSGATWFYHVIQPGETSFVLTNAYYVALMTYIEVSGWNHLPSGSNFFIETQSTGSVTASTYGDGSNDLPLAMISVGYFSGQYAPNAFTWGGTYTGALLEANNGSPLWLGYAADFGVGGKYLPTVIDFLYITAPTVTVQFTNITPAGSLITYFGLMLF